MKTVLIADDEEGVRTLVRMTLEGSSLEVLEAADGLKALDLARRHPPELVILDVRMPGLSGFEVCRALKEDSATAGVRVVMLTAKAQEADRAAGTAAGADDYVTKPFSPAALIEKVHEVLGEKQ